MTAEIEKWREDNITCPYCGWVDTDSWEGGMEHDGDTSEQDCPECDKKFHVQMNIEVSYTSKGLCDENKIKHNWKEFDNLVDGKRCKGKHCLTCDEYEFDKTPELSQKTGNIKEKKQ